MANYSFYRSVKQNTTCNFNLTSVCYFSLVSKSQVVELFILTLYQEDIQNLANFTFGNQLFPPILEYKQTLMSRVMLLLAPIIYYPNIHC